MREQTFEVPHAQTFLDAVFGVVIALPLIDVPKTAKLLLEVRRPETAVTLLLTIAALIFAAFYWLEVRHFLAEQDRFDKAVRDEPLIAADGVPLPLAMFLLGSLFMMVLAAGILTFATFAAFRVFLVMNAAFWLSDLSGTFSLKRTYRPFAFAILLLRQQRRFEYDWFVGHIVTPYFYFYGAINVVVFLALLTIDVSTGGTSTIRVVLASFVLAWTCFRHGLLRASLYTKYRDHRLQQDGTGA